MRGEYKNMENKIWTTKNGDEIEISKMDDQHLLNTIQMLEKQAEEGVVEVNGSNDYYEVVSKSGEVYSKFDQEHWQRSKLRIETRHWMIELLAPKKYGANANQQPQETKQLEPVKVEIVGKYDPDRKGN